MTQTVKALNETLKTLSDLLVKEIKIQKDIGSDIEHDQEIQAIKTVIKLIKEDVKRKEAIRLLVGIQ
jgi:hypothetical protein